MSQSNYYPTFHWMQNGFINFGAGTDTNPNDGWIDNYYLTLFLDPLSSVLLPLAEILRRWMVEFYHFQTIRQPVKSAVAPLQLPSGAGVDLLVSGADNGPLFFNFPPPKSRADRRHVFRPAARSIPFISGGNLIKPTQTIHFAGRQADGQ